MMSKEEMLEIVDEYCESHKDEVDCVGCECDACAVNALHEYFQRLETGVAAEVASRILCAVGDDTNETADCVRDEIADIACDYNFSIGAEYNKSKE